VVVKPFFVVIILFGYHKINGANLGVFALIFK